MASASNNTVNYERAGATFLSEQGSVPEKDIKSLNHTLWEIAEKNTKRNSEGLTVCSTEAGLKHPSDPILRVILLTETF